MRDIKDIIEKRTGLKLEILKSVEYEEGKTYYCGYWQQAFKVIKVYGKENPIGWNNWAVTIEWSDGRQTTHCTRLEMDKDFLVVL